MKIAVALRHDFLPANAMMHSPAPARTPTAGRQLAVAVAFLALICADILVVTHAEDVLPSAARGSGAANRPPASRSQEITVDDRVRRLSDNLSLSIQQQAQVRVILTRRQSELERLRAAPPPSAIGRARLYRAVDEKAIEAIERVLTEEQRQNYSPPRSPPSTPQAPAAVATAASQQSP